MACPQGKTSDGFELQLGTNHLGTFTTPTTTTISLASMALVCVRVYDPFFT